MFDADPKPGDLIEIDRGTYTHWAVYVGENEVGHLIPPTNTDSALSGLLTLLDSSKALVRRDKIWDVVCSSSFHINNLLDDKYRPREPHIIVSKACSLVGRELPYDIVTHNCEHFVTELRYGKSKSQQIETAAVIGGVAAAGVAIAVLGTALFSAFKTRTKEDVVSDGDGTAR